MPRVNIDYRLLRKLFLNLFIICFLLCYYNISYARKAFPGAEGFGTNTVHGRGGNVIHVTNLKSFGPGSFRAACKAQGPRIVVFDVSGIIDLGSKPIDITNPYIYIAGQTAPGDGICLKNSPLVIRTHDVLVRFIRSRPGDNTSGNSPSDRDAITILGDHDGDRKNIEYNVVIDHCSFSWAIDENLSSWFQGLHDVTISWNIISEGLHKSRHPKGPHSKGVIIGPGSKNVSLHHNYFAHNDDRSPLITGNTLNIDVVNNVIYNFGLRASGIGLKNGQTYKTNYVKNYYKRGWNSYKENEGWSSQVEIHNTSDNHWNWSNGLYLKGNKGWNNTSQNEWLATNAPVNYKATSRYQSPAITESSADSVVTLVLKGAGATLPKRDSVDARVVADFNKGTGRIINSQYQVGGWPKYRSTTPLVDTDRDGIPDGWEKNHGLNPNNYSDGSSDRNGDGYTNVEEYVNSLVSSSSPSPSIPPPGAFTGILLPE